MIVCLPAPRSPGRCRAPAGRERGVRLCPGALGQLGLAEPGLRPPGHNQRGAPAVHGPNVPPAPRQRWAAVTLQGHLSPGHGGVVPCGVLEPGGTVRRDTCGSQCPCPAQFGFSAPPPRLPPGHGQRGCAQQCWDKPMLAGSKHPKSEAQKNPSKNLQTFLCDPTSLSVPSPRKKTPQIFLPMPGEVP